MYDMSDMYSVYDAYPTPRRILADWMVRERDACRRAQVLMTAASPSPLDVKHATDGFEDLCNLNLYTVPPWAVFVEGLRDATPAEPEQGIEAVKDIHTKVEAAGNMTTRELLHDLDVAIDAIDTAVACMHWRLHKPDSPSPLVKAAQRKIDAGK